MSLRSSFAAALAACLLAGCTSSPSARQPQEERAVRTSETAEVERRGPAERLGLRPGWGPSTAELDRAVRGVRRLSLPELAGQVIVADFAGTRAPVALVRRLHLGGVIAFSDNLGTARQVHDLNATLTRRVRRPWPLFLSVDQEGGIVERVRAGATRYPAFMAAGAADDPALTRRSYRAAGAELRGMGFTVDFAPVADVTAGPADPTIGSRSAGSRPALVARQVVAAAGGFTASGVVPVLKHFPGHGSVTDDSHLTLPVQLVRAVSWTAPTCAPSPSPSPPGSPRS